MVPVTIIVQNNNNNNDNEINDYVADGLSLEVGGSPDIPYCTSILILCDTARYRTNSIMYMSLFRLLFKEEARLSGQTN